MEQRRGYASSGPSRQGIMLSEIGVPVDGTVVKFWKGGV